MKIEIKNIDLDRVITFLNETNFKGLQSVNRSKVTAYLTKEFQEVAKGEKTIIEDHKDDKEKLKDELIKFHEQTVTIEGANFKAGLNAIKNKIKELTNEECEIEFNGNDAHALSVLYDAFGLGGDDQ